MIPRARRSAQSLVEFAFILPVLLILLLGLFEVGRGFVLGISVQDGAREAARLAANARVSPSISDAALVQRFIDGSAPALAGCSVAGSVSLPVTLSACGGGTWTVSMRITPITGSAGPYISLADARLHGADLNGASIEMKAATPSVALLSGFAIRWSGLALYQIPVQGSATMVAL